MMSSLATSTTYPRIDHRTVLKNLQLETNPNSNNNTCKDPSTNADVFNPIAPTNTKQFLHSNSHITSPRTYILNKSSIATLAPKTKIPYPLATLWSSNQRSSYNNFKRSSSLRMRGTKSNLPLIMEPTINETLTTSTSSEATSATTVNEEKCNSSQNTHEIATTMNSTLVAVTGGRRRPEISTRQKLVLNSQTDANVAEPTTTTTSIKRSLSLRRNYKFSPNHNQNSINFANNQNNKTDSSKDKLCLTTNQNSIAVHDVVQNNCKDQGNNGLKTQTTTITTPTKEEAAVAVTEVDTKTSNNLLMENVKDFNKMVSFNKDFFVKEVRKYLKKFLKLYKLNNIDFLKFPHSHSFATHTSFARFLLRFFVVFL